jgi:hypothetical protein
MVYNGPPPNAFVPWPDGLELPKTVGKYRVIRDEHRYRVEAKGWFFWYPVSHYLVSTPDEVLKVIEIEERQYKLLNVVVESPNSSPSVSCEWLNDREQVEVPVPFGGTWQVSWPKWALIGAVVILLVMVFMVAWIKSA